ncbi:MAG: hypothetical protein P8P99_02540 [Maricaulis sp.]|nr:hypothetical protein [Maricaulis sp.]
MNMLVKNPMATDHTVSSALHYPPSSGIADTLKAVVGDFAEDVATHFPYPHTELFTQPFSRIQLLGVRLALKKKCQFSYRDTINVRWNVATKQIFDHKVFGLKNILSKLPKTMLTKNQYLALVRVLESPKTQKFLWQTPEIPSSMIEALDALQPALHTAHILKHVSTREEAVLLARIARNNNTKALANRLKNKPSRHQFYSELSDFFFSNLGRFQQGPEIDDPRITPIQNAEQLVAFANHMKNCLRNYVSEGLDGERSYYKFSGTVDVAISIERRIDGRFIINEMESVSNNPFPDEVREQVVEIFAKHGIEDCSQRYMHWIDKISGTLCQLGSFSTDDASGISKAATFALCKIPTSYGEN